MTVWDHNDKFNVNDHGGYMIKDLYINQKYESFKQEILHYQFLANDNDGTDRNLSIYTKIILPKVNEYMTTNIVKKKRAFLAQHPNTVQLKYDIKTGNIYNPEIGDPIHSEHLLSLILYTDFSDLSREFSSTFRKLEPHEPLKSIKARNRNYWWMSKRLRECVQIYGNGGYFGDVIKGKYYCGISFEAVFPSFQIRLCAPTSTTDKIEIATRFAGDKGIVVQLNNNVHGHLHHIKGFYCAWISRFAEESETVFFGGHYRVSIESLRAIKTNKNYYVISNALSKFNAMIKGSYVRQKDVDAQEKHLILKLIEDKLRAKGNDLNKNGIDEYMMRTFKAYTNHQRQIILDLHWLYDNDGDLLDLIMEEIVRGKQLNDDDGRNLFKLSLFEIYENVEEVHIYTTRYTGSAVYYFSFWELLKRIEILKFERIMVKAIRKGSEDKYNDDKDYGTSWLKDLWGIYKERLCRSYQSKGMTIYLLNAQENSDNYIEDCVVITRFNA